MVSPCKTTWPVSTDWMLTWATSTEAPSATITMGRSRKALEYEPSRTSRTSPGATLEAASCRETKSAPAPPAASTTCTACDARCGPRRRRLMTVAQRWSSFIVELPRRPGGQWKGNACIFPTPPTRFSPQQFCRAPLSWQGWIRRRTVHHMFLARAYKNMRCGSAPGLNSTSISSITSPSFQRLT